MLMERVCTPEYLRIMGISLLQGRGLTEADGAPSAQRVVLISKSTAERFWPANHQSASTSSRDGSTPGGRLSVSSVTFANTT
jgi:hypothetical protein